MPVTRRALIAAASAALLTRGQARGQRAPKPSPTIAAARCKCRRACNACFPAGPPAAILLYTLAPTLLIGWPRANRLEECVYMLPDICRRPEVGRITGRGNTANLETRDRAQA